MAFLQKAVKGLDATCDELITEEEKAGFQLLFDSICEDLKAIPKEFHKEHRIEMEKKSEDLIIRN
jgi:hypothetical protein